MSFLFEQKKGFTMSNLRKFRRGHIDVQVENAKIYVKQSIANADAFGHTIRTMTICNNCRSITLDSFLTFEGFESYWAAYKCERCCSVDRTTSAVMKDASRVDVEKMKIHAKKDFKLDLPDMDTSHFNS